MTGSRARFTAAVTTLLLLAAGASTASPTPPLLSADESHPDIASTHGSGNFGSWTVDRFDLPAYRYTIDEETAPIAAQPELDGRTDAWHQVGNDHIVANALNHGYFQLWSQDRLYQWTNLYDEANRHFGGGYGYLRRADSVISTLYDDRPGGAQTEREFGMGYARKLTATTDVEIEEFVYAPFGDDPVLLHDVSIRNTSATTIDSSWFEYWDVNPVIQALGRRQRGMRAPVWELGRKMLSVEQTPDEGDLDPLTIFLSALRGPVSGFETDAEAFFGSGGRASPSAVRADLATGSIAPASPSGVVGRTMFAMRAPLSIAPGQTVQLRYAYGAAHPQTTEEMIDRYAASDNPLADSAAAWREWLPKASFPDVGAWLARELQWDAYMVRSGATYEETFHRHIISQGGYYQYDSGFQGAFRDPLQHMLPMIWANPALARDVIVYSAMQQPAETGFIPYAMLHLGRRFDLGSSDDLDFWLFLAVVEYVNATRDFAFLDEVIPYADHGEASLWEHLRLAFLHQETIVGRGPHGGYITGLTGDWSDFSTQFMQMTESMLVVAQLAYAYPELAAVADRRGDTSFAAQLRAAASALQATLDQEWTARGWFSRGYAGAQRLGDGVIYLEPQPWALLASAASDEQSVTLVGNIRRFLTGVGAPDALKGPARIGSAQSPAYIDPEVTERTPGLTGPDGDSQPGVGALNSGSNNAVWVGGVWYALNGSLTWALGELDGVVPDARAYAWDEFVRNTLYAHATAFPDHWDGILSVDDVCHAFYQTDPSRCGTGLTTAYNTQIMHQPAWSLFALQRLVGLEPTTDGLRIAPHVPSSEFTLRLPNTGIASEPGMLRGYLRTERDDELEMRVRHVGPVTAWVDGVVVPHDVEGDEVVFGVPAHAGTAVDWAITW